MAVLLSEILALGTQALINAVAIRLVDFQGEVFTTGRAHAAAIGREMARLCCHFSLVIRWHSLNDPAPSVSAGDDVHGDCLTAHGARDCARPIRTNVPATSSGGVTNSTAPSDSSNVGEGALFIL